MSKNNRRKEDIPYDPAAKEQRKKDREEAARLRNLRRSTLFAGGRSSGYPRELAHMTDRQNSSFVSCVYRQKIRAGLESARMMKRLPLMDWEVDSLKAERKERRQDTRHACAK